MAKIHINLSQGVIDIEGDEAFVREAFADVRSSMSGMQVQPLQRVVDGGRSVEPDSLDGTEAGAKSKSEPNVRRKVVNSARPKKSGSEGISSYYAASINTSLDLAALDEFCDRFEVKNSKERVLVFSMFLAEKLNIKICSADDIYSCFWHMRDQIGKIPEAFGKLLRESASAGLIVLANPQNISVPVSGFNALQRLKRKDA